MTTPMTMDLFGDTTSERVDATLYRQMIGSRPDICFTAMLPETGNGKRYEKRERYEKRNFKVSHVQETRREKKIKVKVKKVKQSIHNQHSLFT